MNAGFPLFNTPLEAGLRSLTILSRVHPGTCDLQRLVFYDYLIVHSGDIPGGPDSLHPNTPLRSGELLVRRSLVEDGLRLMISRGLLSLNYSPTGMEYASTVEAQYFLAYMESSYHQEMKQRADWINTKFSSLPNAELSEFMSSNIDRWASEFTKETRTHEAQ